jgi:phenylpyruvate tautomerase PptA (4-oxalocrotonate tautomerase family)
MPCLEISLPKTDLATKRELCSRLTDLVEDVAGFERQIFRIRFSEYEPGEAGSGGVIWDGENGVPYLHAVLYCPRLKRSTKQRLVENLMQIFPEILRHPDWFPVVHICEHPYDNIGGSGTWLPTRPGLAERQFYYELPKD